MSTFEEFHFCPNFLFCVDMKEIPCIISSRLEMEKLNKNPRGLGLKMHVVPLFFCCIDDLVVVLEGLPSKRLSFGSSQLQVVGNKLSPQLC